ncbi:cytidylyltransferase domain-containing protein [Schumannella soli]|uniref:Spore coat protein n=1 Tax=Schumannella soli TaxID=2590779 RepID=A0A506Y7P2_9MICO|nr:NTP transferase domain-containing protein [Schumannella soli]TPW77247.1 spore coat protein [Schumannella soli]
MTVAAVIQARAGSTRLPAKVLRRLGSRSVLEWVVDAARAAPGIDAIVIATSTEPADDAIAAEAERLGVGVVRGSEDDVLSRYRLAIETTRPEAVVRLTGDCPLLDPSLIAQVVAIWRADPRLQYVATTLQRTLPRGLDVELARADALLAADGEATAHHRAHVTSWLYRDESAVPRAGLVVAPRADDLRVTLDEPDDARLIEAIVAELGNDASEWRRVVDLLRSRPDLVEINAHVEQKALDAG